MVIRFNFSAQSKCRLPSNRPSHPSVRHCRRHQRQTRTLSRRPLPCCPRSATTNPTPNTTSHPPPLPAVALLLLHPIMASSPQTKESAPPSTPREISNKLLLLDCLTSRRYYSTPMVPHFPRHHCRRPPPRTLHHRLLLSRSPLCITLPSNTLLSIALRPSRPHRLLHCHLPLLLILRFLSHRLLPSLLHLSHPLPLLFLPLTQPNPCPLRKPPIPGIKRSHPSHSSSRSPPRGFRRQSLW